MSKRQKLTLAIVAGFIGIGGGVYLAARLLIPTAYIPPVFSEARINGAGFAKNIVSLLEESVRHLQEIAAFDREGNAPEALTLISQEVIKNRNIQQEAIKLSSELEKMARAIPEVRPDSARFAATEALSSEIALVSHLLNYTAALRELFDVLRSKLNRTTATEEQVRSLIAGINREAEAINDLNQKFNNALQELDNAILK